MKMNLIKPDMTIPFASMCLTGKYLKEEYDKANTYDELYSLTLKWFNDSAETKNNIKKNYLEASAKYLYAFLTGKSYESKITI